jgi:hypothetical protein
MSRNHSYRNSHPSSRKVGRFSSLFDTHSRQKHRGQLAIAIVAGALLGLLFILGLSIVLMRAG